jgi:hypothetical protein
MPTTITGTDGVSQVQAGAVESGDLPAGSVIQVVTASRTSETTTTSTSYVNTGLQASITPTSTSNKILILVHDVLRAFNTGDSFRGEYGLFKGATNLLEFGFGVRSVSNTGTATCRSPTSISFIDTPNTASEIIYKTMIKAIDDTVESNFGNNKSTITLMEIAG